tara:strand:+ start:214 stop:792 length:579 start_codon:yes stop_codon:yes gene_type:complete
MLIKIDENFAFLISIILVGIIIIPNALASHDSDKQWGTVYADKYVLELAYTSSDNSQPEKIRIFGTVEEPRSAGIIYMTITEPDGEAYQVKVRPNGNYGTYENFILICCNNVGPYSVYAEWRGYHIGTITFDVIQKTKSQELTTAAPDTESIDVIPGWIKNSAGWWAGGQIDDSSYLLGIQYLVQFGIIKVG